MGCGFTPAPFQVGVFNCNYLVSSPTIVYKVFMKQISLILKFKFAGHLEPQPELITQRQWTLIDPPREQQHAGSIASAQKMFVE